MTEVPSYGDEIFSHTDRNTLHRVGDPLPSPLSANAVPPATNG